MTPYDEDDRLYGAWMLVLAIRARNNATELSRLVASQAADDNRRRAPRSRRTKSLTDALETQIVQMPTPPVNVQ